MLADAHTLSALHARCFTTPRPWSSAEFATLLADPACVTLTTPHGFATARIVLDEAEVLTICIAPESQNQGHGRILLLALHTALQARRVHEVFLEVATTNSAARSLYAKAGYAEAGIRKDYYQSAGKTAVHAVVLRCSLAKI